MPEGAAAQLNRVVQLVAELSRRDTPVPVPDLAREFGISEDQVLADVRLLTLSGEASDTTWLLSISAYQEGDAVSVSSQGPYRRPIRLTSEELLALQVALATEPEPPSHALRELLSLREGEVDDRIQPAPFVQGEEGGIVDLARLAMNARRPLRLEYGGEGAGRVTTRTIHPHSILYQDGHFYISAWCEEGACWRLFRADRVLEATLLEGTFSLRDDEPDYAAYGRAFRAPDEGVDEVRVRFSKDIARWIQDRYPDAEPGPGGSVVVAFQSASIDWAVRTVLQYGPDAEVLEPPAYREAMRRAVTPSN